MIQLKKYFSFFLILSIMGCSPQKNILEKTLASDNPKIKRVMDNAKDHEIQIIYTQILRDKKGNISDLIKIENLNKVINEINKCIVLCANCHRKLHN